MSHSPLLWHCVAVRGRRWEVWLSAVDLQPDILHHRGERVAAVCCPDGKIVIDVTEQPARYPVLLLHELSHAAIWPESPRGEEGVVRLLDEPLTETLVATYHLRFPPLPRGWRTLRAWACRRDRRASSDSA